MKVIRVGEVKMGAYEVEQEMDEALVAAFERLVEKAERWRAQGMRIVHCHGCFDPLHVGHVRYFEQARAMGDRLIVTITSDRFVRRQKGADRPCFAQHLRLEMIRALRVVDATAVNLWDRATQTIERLRPDLYVKGEEYRARLDAGESAIQEEDDAVRRHGGVLVNTGGATWSSTRLVTSHAHLKEQGRRLAMAAEGSREQG